MDLVCASANPNKYSEISQILSGAVNLIPRPAEIPEVVEDADTLEGNARLKAIAVRMATGCAAVADDTGLEVDFLNGAPGVYTARYAGENCTYQDNVNKLFNVMKDVPIKDRGAQFKTSMVYLDNNKELYSDGVVKGIISEKIKGLAGFGYDPLFYIPKEGKTFAEMSIEKKNIISHRGLAIKGLIAKIDAYFKTLKKENA